jgi:hypothetical protein
VVDNASATLAQHTLAMGVVYHRKRIVLLRQLNDLRQSKEVGRTVQYTHVSSMRVTTCLIMQLRTSGSRARSPSIENTPSVTICKEQRSHIHILLDYSAITNRG